MLKVSSVSQYPDAQGFFEAIVESDLPPTQGLGEVGSQEAVSVLERHLSTHLGIGSPEYSDRDIQRITEVEGQPRAIRIMLVKSGS